MIIGLSVVSGIGIIVVGKGIGVYNTIVTGKNDYDGQLADLGAHYQRRADLYMNLSEVVKKNVAFEKDTFIGIAKARAGIKTEAPNKGNMIAKLGAMDSMISGLKIQIEAYPELKSNEQFNKLMSEIEVTENFVTEQRDELNNIAQDFNTYIGLFPTNVYANIFKTKQLVYFKPKDDAEDKGIIKL